MPLVTNNSINIVIQAQDNATKELEKISAELDKLENNVDNFSKSTDNSTGKVTDFASALGIAEKVLTGVYNVAKESYGAFQEYAGQVRDLAAVSGESAEESSRLLQVLDDFEISAQDVTTAVRFMTKNGLVPNIETLKELSDQYLAIQDPMERNEFILKNLGRSGLQWLNVLKQGSDALEDVSNEVNKNLILTDEQIIQAEKARLAVDAWADAWQGLKVAAGAAIGGMIIQGQEFSKEQEYLAMVTGHTVELHELDIDATNALTAEYDRATQMGAYWAKVLGNVTVAEQEQVTEIKNLTKENENYLSMIGKIGGELERYSEKEADLQTKHAELIARKQELISQGWGPESEKIAEINAKLAENDLAMQKNAEETELAGRRRILSMLEQQLAIDGLDVRETNYLLGLGLKWGVYSQAAVDAAQAAIVEVTALKASFDSLPTDKTMRISIQVSSMLNQSLSAQAAEDAIRAEIGFAQGTGGWRTVPPGYNNDTYPVLLSSGEKFAVVRGGGQPAGYAGGTGMGGVTVNLSYSPTMSLGDETELRTRLVPLIINGVKEARAQGVIQ